MSFGRVKPEMVGESTTSKMGKWFTLDLSSRIASTNWLFASGMVGDSNVITNRIAAIAYRILFTDSKDVV